MVRMSVHAPPAADPRAGYRPQISIQLTASLTHPPPAASFASNPALITKLTSSEMDPSLRWPCRRARAEC